MTDDELSIPPWKRTESDPVSHPRHYQGPGGMEAKDAMEGYFGKTFMADYWLGCALKYLYRYCVKNGAQDLDKAVQCIGYLKEAEYGDGCE